MLLQDLTSSKSRAAAILDLLEGASGLALALFLWAHMLFVASIYLGPEAYDAVPRFLDRTYLSYVGIPPVVILFFLHFLLAARKIPFAWRQQRVAVRHAGLLRHKDTTTWLVQVVTGMAILLLGAIHFWFIFTSWPIESFRSTVRVGQNSYFVFYLFLLVLGELHAGIGLYRLAVKWGWPPRRGAELLFEILSAAVILTGLGALFTFRILGRGGL